MNYLMIENKGVLDTEALVLIGASTKRDEEGKIGFFGSGNKYALATLLRLEVPFQIFAGEQEIEISSAPVSFRGKSFNRIYINGEATSLTTDMGPQWEEWMAIREFVSNSIDEGGSNIITSMDQVSGKEGSTRIYVAHTPKIKEIVENWDLLFTFDREDVVYENADGKLFQQKNNDEHMLLFRRGIRAYKSTTTKSLFHYDMKNFVINESRLIDSTYSAAYIVARYLAKITDLNIIKKVISNSYNTEYWESQIDWKYCGTSLSPEWEEAIKGRAIVLRDVAEFYSDVIQRKPHYLVSTSMGVMLKRQIPEIKIYGLNEDGNTFAFCEVDQTPKMEYLIREACKFLEETQYNVKFPIKVVKFEREAVLGQAHENTILLSDTLFSMGKKEIVSTIIEENEHLVTGMKDFTRSFQNHFINLFLTEKEERFGLFL